MRWTKWIAMVALLTLMAQGAVWAKEGALPFQLSNRLRFEYDDNIYQTDGDITDKTGSFKIIEEIEFLVNLNLQDTYVGLRYRPNLVWYDKREDNKTDFLNDLDFNFNHAFTRRLMLSLSDTLRRGELPELTDGNYMVREQDDYYYNTANAALGYLLRPETRLDLAGRYTILSYDNDSAAKTNNNYDIWVGGLTLRQQLASKTTVLGDFRYEMVRYKDNPEINRDANSIYVGAGAEQTFSPNLVGNLRAGYQHKSFDNDDLFDNESAPYGELALTVIPSPATRLTVGGSYALSQSDVDAYADQRRAQAFASLAYDITARIAWYLTGSYSHNQYKGEQSVGGLLDDGADKITQVSTRLTYKVFRNNWLEAGWIFEDLNSDVLNRVSYKRNRLDLGWKITL